LRDWLIEIGWSKPSAAAASIAVAALAAYLVGWCFRLLARVPRHRFLETSDARREAIGRWRVVPHTTRVAAVITNSFLSILTGKDVAAFLSICDYSKSRRDTVFAF
jgi:hypothetical protein